MVFGVGSINCEIKLNLNRTEIERAYETKFLGVVMDHKLCWKPQIEHIKRKLSKSISVLFKTRLLLNSKCLYVL